MFVFIIKYINNSTIDLSISQIRFDVQTLDILFVSFLVL